MEEGPGIRSEACGLLKRMRPLFLFGADRVGEWEHPVFRNTIYIMAVGFPAFR